MKSKDNIPPSISAENVGQEASSEPNPTNFTRRLFLHSVGLAAAAVGLQQIGCSAPKQAIPASAGKQQPIEGLANVENDSDLYKGWAPVSDRKIRVGIVGYGLSKFGAAFGFQNHPNVEV